MASVGVIGGGFGGIAAALRMRAKGHEVTLFDRCERLGGRAQVFQEGGYTFDAGPTVITAPILFEELFQLFDESLSDSVDLVPLDPWYRFHFADGETFDYGGTLEQTLAEVERLCPPDVEGYKRLLDQSQKIFEVGFNQLADQPFHNFFTMVKQIPQLIKLKSYRSMWDLVRSNLIDRRLQQAFSIQPLLVGGNPMDTTCIYGLIHYLERKWGVHFPMGGTGALVASLGELMKRQGIAIELGTTITDIRSEGHTVKGVHTEAGTYYPFDAVVSDIDPTYLYGQLLDNKAQSLSARLKTRYSEHSMGLFVLFFGTSTQYHDVAHHTIVMGERYESLLDDIFKKKILADDFSMYLHRPTATDSSFAPEGHDAFYVLVPVPNLTADIDWHISAEKLSKRIVERLENTVLPNLRETITVQFHMSPLDFSSSYLSVHGSGFTISPLFYQSAWFRFHNRGEGLKNLFLVGAGTHPGAGIPGVLSSAKVVDNLTGMLP